MLNQNPSNVSVIEFPENIHPPTYADIDMLWDYFVEKKNAESENRTMDANTAFERYLETFPYLKGLFEDNYEKTNCTTMYYCFSEDNRLFVKYKYNNEVLCSVFIYSPTFLNIAKQLVDGNENKIAVFEWYDDNEEEG